MEFIQEKANLRGLGSWPASPNPKDPNLYPNLTDEKVRKFMGKNIEAGGDGIAGDNSVSFAEYVEGGVIVVLVVA